MLYAVARRAPQELLVAFYEFNRPIHVNTLVDISAVVEKKRRACGMYATQLANYPYTDCALGLNRYRALTVSPSCQYAEGFVALSNRELKEWSADAFSEVRWPSPLVVTSPLVSIIVRTADRQALLADALASIVTQTCANLEVIVVNDGGHDVSHVLAAFGSRLAIRPIHHDKSRGRAGAANSGLAAARGKYINFLDDDDRLYPNHVGKLVTYLERTGELVAYSDCEQGRYHWVDDEWRLMGERTPFMGIDYDWDRLHLGNYIPIMSVMFRRSLLERVDLMNKALEFLEDWDFWLRLAACTPFQRLRGITAEYRVFTGSKYSARQWHRTVLQKHRDYWCIENMYDLASRLVALDAKKAELEHALECAVSQRRRTKAHALEAEAQRQQVETRLVDAEAVRRQAEACVAEVEGVWQEGQSRLAAVEAVRLQADARLVEMEGLWLEAKARWQRAEAIVSLLQRSVPMRLSRHVQRCLHRSAVEVIRAWGTRKT